MTEKLTERDYEVLDACCELLSIKIEELKAENDRLKARKDKYYQQTLDDEIQINELLQTLQEIKAIAERCNLCEECSGLEDCERECGDAAEPCSTYQMQIILNKITKAEGK